MVPTRISYAFVIVLYICSFYLTRSELFTAMSHLEKVLYAEQEVAEDLKAYIKQEEDRINLLKRIAEDYENHSRTALVDVERHLANPVNAFLLVKRFTSDFEKVKSVVNTNSHEVFLQGIQEKTSSFPDSEDLAGAATALLRLQDTYALPTDRIAKGQIKGVKYSQAMSAEDCYQLGRVAYNDADYYHTIMWMEQALQRWEEEEPKTIDKTVLLDYLAYAVYVQGNIRHALELTLEWLKIDPNHSRALTNKKYYTDMLEQEEKAAKKKGDDDPIPQQSFTNKRQLDEYRQSEEFNTYERLCRGEDVIKYKLAHKLTCQYRRHHPLFYINPLREETIYFKPWIAVYHDAMTESEIAKIKEIAGPKLNRATVQNPQTGKLETANYRVSKSAWLKDADDRLIQRVTNKVSAMVNLTTETVEELQVVNYGIGGHYEPHYDFARPRERKTFDEWRGNRILTAIFYMSDVEAGGATVFPQIGVKMYPEKGACAVWYNLRKNGEGDYDTRHAGCPVLTGSKWVCNKWFHERGQELIRPCSTNSAE